VPALDTEGGWESVMLNLIDKARVLSGLININALSHLFSILQSLPLDIYLNELSFRGNSVFD
jgi:hypothetical protein